MTDEKSAGKQTLQRREVDEALRGLLEHVGGRRFLFDIFVRSSVWASSFTGNSTTFYNEGHRNLALLIQGQIEEIDPAIMYKLKKEFGNG